MRIDGKIKLIDNRFKFDEVAEQFDKHISKSIPFYEEIHNLVSDMAYWFAEEETNIYDIGCSTGLLIKKLDNKLAPLEKCRIIGIDNSPEMIKMARKTNKSSMKTVATVGDITCVNIDNASFITALFTMQFTTIKNRLHIFKKIYDGLNNRGAFIMVEKIYPDTALIGEMWTQLYHDKKHTNGLTVEEIFNKDRAIRGVMKPQTHSKNIEMLQQAGFSQVTTFFQYNNFVGYLCIKETI